MKPPEHVKPDFKTRSTLPEMMDNVPVSAVEFHECLEYLQTINVLTLAYRPTLRWIKKIIAPGGVAAIKQPDGVAAIKKKGAGGARTAGVEPLTIFDIGSGGGDMLRKIWKMTRGAQNPPRLTGVDMNPQAAESARRLSPQGCPVRFETADIFSFPSDRSADLVISSLFTHHLTNAELVSFIRWMERHATEGWFINDLHRHPLPYWFIRRATALLCPNRLIVHDAPLSVARSFTAADWKMLLAEAGVPAGSVTIRWYFPFRYCIARRK